MARFSSARVVNADADLPPFGPFRAEPEPVGAAEAAAVMFALFLGAIFASLLVAWVLS